MLKRLYTILGATGHIGLVLSQELLRRGHHVRALGRSPKKLGILKTLGAETISFENYTDEDALRHVFLKADAVFSFIPPNYAVDDNLAYQELVGKAIKTAIKKAKVHHVLNLSSIGAELSEGTGPILGLHRNEKALNTLSGVSILHLRASYFMENLLGYIESIKESGTIADAMDSNAPFPMVATQDIGRKAAEIMDQLNFKGQSIFDFTGPKEVTMNEAASILGNAIGKTDIKYVQLSYEDYEQGMIKEGFKPDFAKLIVEMTRAGNEGRLHMTQPITLEHRGKTTLEEWAKDFARIAAKGA